MIKPSGLAIDRDAVPILAASDMLTVLIADPFAAARARPNSRAPVTCPPRAIAFTAVAPDRTVVMEIVDLTELKMRVAPARLDRSAGSDFIAMDARVATAKLSVNTLPPRAFTATDSRAAMAAPPIRPPRTADLAAMMPAAETLPSGDAEARAADLLSPAELVFTSVEARATMRELVAADGRKVLVGAAACFDVTLLRAAIAAPEPGIAVNA